MLILAFVLAWAGCSSGGSSIDDSQIISALNLKKASSGYEMNGDPFCRIDELLNDVDEVKKAQHQKGSSFVIAAPNGKAGVSGAPALRARVQARGPGRAEAARPPAEEEELGPVRRRV